MMMADSTQRTRNVLPSLVSDSDSAEGTTDMWGVVRERERDEEKREGVQNGYSAGNDRCDVSSALQPATLQKWFRWEKLWGWTCVGESFTLQRERLLQYTSQAATDTVHGEEKTKTQTFSITLNPALKLRNHNHRDESRGEVCVSGDQRSLMFDSVWKVKSGGREKSSHGETKRKRNHDNHMSVLLFSGSLPVYHPLPQPQLSTFIYLLHVASGVFTLVTESIHTSGWKAPHKLSYLMDVQVLMKINRSLRWCEEGFKTRLLFHSPGHIWGCAVRPGGHRGRRPTVGVRRSPGPRRDRGSPGRRRPGRGPTRAGAGGGSRRSSAVWSWTGGRRPGGS